MSFRAPDIKDEHGWQVLHEDGSIESWAPSRDKARHRAQTGDYVEGLEYSENGGPIERSYDIAFEPNEIEVLPADDSPEAVAAREAQRIHERIVQRARTLRSVWVDLAADLYAFQESRMWEALGYETLQSYLADPDVAIEYRWFFDHTATYNPLVVERHVAPERLKELPPSNVVRVLPAIRRDQVTVEEAFADVQALGRSDLDLKYSGRASSTPGRPSTGTKVETDEEPNWGVCATCGARKRIDPKTGEFLR